MRVRLVNFSDDNEVGELDMQLWASYDHMWCRYSKSYVRVRKYCSNGLDGQSSVGMLISFHYQNFKLFAALKLWIYRLPIGQERIDAWVDVITQVEIFFQESSHFSLCLIRSIQGNKSFQKCLWTFAKMDAFLYSLQAHVDAAAGIQSRSTKAYKSIDRE